MKILEIAPGNLRGGAETVQVHLFRELQMHDDVTVHALLFSRGFLESSLIRENIPVKVIPVRFRSFFNDMNAVKQTVDALRPDIIHSHNFKSNITSALFGSKSAKRVATIHGPFEPMKGLRGRKMAVYQRINRWSLRSRFDRIVVVSQELSRGPLLRGISVDRLAIIRNAIPVTAEDENSGYERDRNPNDAFTIGTAGRLEVVKGNHVLLDAFASALPKLGNARLLVFGEGPEESNLKSQARSMGIESSVELAGFEEDIRRAFSQLDLLVIPSLDEGLPLILLEAMSYGLPVLAASVGEIPRVLENGAAGLLVRPGDPIELAERLVEAKNSADLKSLSRRARDVVRHNYDAEAMAARYLSLFRSLL
jgi:glycosyltransferase involved in cell wall biosynthesis